MEGFVDDNLEIHMNTAATETKVIKLKAVGDICPGDKTIIGLGIHSISQQLGADYFFNEVGSLLHDADLLIGNFEGLLSKKKQGNSVSQLSFCGEPAFVDAMKMAGFTLVTVANNHTLEHGPKKFEETVTMLEKAGIAVCGLRCNSGKYYSKPVILNVHSRKIGFLGYNWVGVDKFPEADRYISQSRDSLVNYTWDRKKQNSNQAFHANTNVIRDIKTLKEETDYVVLLPHWGYEFVHYPPHGVICEAKSFVEAGADMIIGSHPHVLQGMEFFDGKPVFYSLGDFIFDFRSRFLRDSVILSTEILDNHIDFKYLPVVIDKKFQPRPANVKEANRIHKLLAAYDTLKEEAVCDLLEDDNAYRAYENNYNKIKIQNIIHHFSLLPSNPLIAKVILRKLFSAMGLVGSRLRGKAIRW
jgi:poly-gamma-glutamate synthesis protein (capsule biosynthesis protein)